MTKLTLGFYTNKLTAIRNKIKSVKSQKYPNPEEVRVLREQEGYYQNCIRKFKEKKENPEKFMLYFNKLQGKNK